MHVRLETVDARRVRHASLALAVVIAAAGCGRRSGPAPAIAMEFETTPRPPRTGMATIGLSLSDSRRQPVSRADIELEGNMTHAGMAPVFGHAVEFQPGRYRSQLDFTMPGDWVVQVHVKLASGQQVEKQFEIRGVRSQ